MKIEQLYTGCLAQGAYYIESNGEVAIIDPLREVQTYIDLASERKSKIKYIFETHFHADFVSGHVTLAEKTGAPIIFGPNASPTFKTTIAVDNQEFKLGDVTIRVLHTPDIPWKVRAICCLMKTTRSMQFSVVILFSLAM